jgi:hypothetical protein
MYIYVYTLGVSMGAIGAHSIKNKDEAQKDMWKVFSCQLLS